MKTKVYLIISCALLTASCNRIYYAPNSQNIPMHKEKNEFTMNLGVGTGDEFVSTELQGSFSLTDHLAIQANSSIYSAGSSAGLFYEVAPGYFGKLGQSGVIEFYGGYGNGSVFSQYTYEEVGYDRAMQADFNKYFIQPSIGLTHKNIDLAVSSKLSMLDYYHDVPLYTEYNASSGLSVKRMNQFYVFEPAITARLGWRHFKFQFQYVHVLPLIEGHAQQVFYVKSNFNVAMHLAFGGHFKKSKKTYQHGQRRR